MLPPLERDWRLCCAGCCRLRREISTSQNWPKGWNSERGTVGFHNFNLRIFNLSLKSEQINCGCFFDTMSDFNVPGSRPKETR